MHVLPGRDALHRDRPVIRRLRRAGEHASGCPFCSDASCCQGTNYGLNGDGPGMFVRYPECFKLADVVDGTSNTLMVGEVLPRQNIHNKAFDYNMSIGVTNVPLNLMLNRSQWAVPGLSDGQLHAQNPHAIAQGYRSRHPGGAQFVLGDSSVRFLAETVDFTVYNRLGTRYGGEAAVVP